MLAWPSDVSVGGGEGSRRHAYIHVCVCVCMCMCMCIGGICVVLRSIDVRVSRKKQRGRGRGRGRSRRAGRRGLPFPSVVSGSGGGGVYTKREGITRGYPPIVVPGSSLHCSCSCPCPKPTRATMSPCSGHCALASWEPSHRRRWPRCPRVAARFCRASSGARHEWGDGSPVQRASKKHYSPRQSQAFGLTKAKRLDLPSTARRLDRSPKPSKPRQALHHQKSSI